MEDLTGRTIGGYQIIEKIGRGGMATVFRAYQPSLDRDVAIKVLPPYYAEQDETFHQRFKREARAIAKLRHPNILMVIDFGEEDDLAYIVMEYITAGTLKERMQQPMKLEEIAVLVHQISSALAYAHGQGIVHRDVKPSNIMMPKPDWALLTDFGLARMVGGNSVLTQSGITVGTPAYMSPEQGSGDRVDHRTDIYALGVILYEMVVGEVPYTAETPMAVVVKHIVDPLPIPREKNPDIPEEVQRIILKALAKKPDDRYQSVVEMAAALGTVSEINPDWSATEIMAVDAVRQPRVDKLQTKVIVEDKPDEELAEAVTYAQPADSEAGAPLQEPELESAEVESEEESQPETIVVEKDQAEEDLAEAATYVHVGELEAEGVVEEPVEVPPEAEVEDAGRPKRSRRWLVYFGGAATVFVLIMIGLLVVGGIRGAQNEMNLTDEAQLPAVEEQLPPEVGDEVEPDQPLDEMPRITELLEQGEFDRARELAVEMVRRSPDKWEQFMGLVYMLVERENFPQAARLLEAGLEVNPDAPAESYLLLGGIMREQGMMEESLPQFEKALRLDPGYWDAHNALVFTAIGIDQAPRAIDFFIGLAEEHPDEALMYLSLGELYSAVEDWDAAVRNYERALEIAPDVPQFMVRAAGAYVAIGDHPVAVELADRAVELAPDNPNLLGRAASTFLDMGIVERAHELYARAFELDENNGGNALGLAISLFLLGEDPDRVQALLQTTERLAREQEDPRLMNHLGWVYIEMGDCDNAVRIFEMVEEFAPGETDAQQGIDQCR